MYKSDKRHLNIRNKLFAAIAMLLVSSIMMVSTTYAWFTLSTAPEVQGITTTVGANGALEIALSPLSGEPGEITTNVGDSVMTSWVTKNLTWGNLLDLSDEAYELSEIDLMPSQLQLVGDEAQLARPAYGTDGRVSALVTDVISGGKAAVTQPDGSAGLTSGFVSDGGFGVRALGTASGMSANQKVRADGKADLTSFSSKATQVLKDSIQSYGNALATMVVTHAMAGNEDTNNYAEYVDALTALVGALDTSVDHIESALKGALLMVAASELTGDALTSAETLIKTSTVSALISSLGSMGIAVPDQFQTVVTKLSAISGEITTASTTLENAKADTVNWKTLESVVFFMVDTNGTITINNHSYEDVAKNPENYALEMVLQGVNLTLSTDSGVYYDISLVADEFFASTSVTLDPTKLGDLASVISDATDIRATITTDIGASVPMLDGIKTAVENLGTADEDTDGSGETEATSIDSYYGYILDFVVRTNAANSYLQLQSDALNRIYAEDGSAATMGHGSTFTFTVPEGVDAGIVKGLVESLRVVFFDTETNVVYGVAKADVNDAEATDKLVGTLKLYEYTTTNGMINVTTVKADDPTTEQNEAVTLCELGQNEAKRISVMVSLDGNNITNADILADGKIAGMLNLQFSSSVNLVPMENADLKSGTTTGGSDEGENDDADEDVESSEDDENDPNT